MALHAQRLLYDIQGCNIEKQISLNDGGLYNFTCYLHFRLFDSLRNEW